VRNSSPPSRTRLSFSKLVNRDTARESIDFEFSGGSRWSVHGEDTSNGMVEHDTALLSDPTALWEI
jgi:dihydroorotase-like cyclic amidohydrolase